jgi:hypothetical protein
MSPTIGKVGSRGDRNGQILKTAFDEEFSQETGTLTSDHYYRISPVALISLQKYIFRGLTCLPGKNLSTLDKTDSADQVLKYPRSNSFREDLVFIADSPMSTQMPTISLFKRACLFGVIFFNVLNCIRAFVNAHVGFKAILFVFSYLVQSRILVTKS